VIASLNQNKIFYKICVSESPESIKYLSFLPLLIYKLDDQEGGGRCIMRIFFTKQLSLFLYLKKPEMI